MLGKCQINYVDVSWNILVSIGLMDWKSLSPWVLLRARMQRTDDNDPI